MTPISTYKDALDYIYRHVNYERIVMPKYDMTTLDLSRITAALAPLNNPHRQYPVLLIAGSKGKGSTAAMCHSTLCAAGYTVGLFSSPHLHSFRERIKLGRNPISEEAIIDLINQIRPALDAVPGITIFEIMTTLAFAAFAQVDVDIAVLEVGLGGRLDSTNVSNPAVSVITSISYDHTHLLGNTLDKIAREKAGIIRRGGRVVSAPQYPEAMSAIEEVCAENEARLTVAGDEIPFRVGRSSLQGQTVHIDGEAYRIPLLGEHQAANAATAWTALRALQAETDLRISVDAMKEGLASVEWAGRLEILSAEPMLVVDSAMNDDSARKLARALQTHFPGRNLLLVFGASADHDYGAMLAELLPNARKAIVTKSTHPRAAEPEQLAQAAQSIGFAVETAPTVADALNAALDSAEERDLICVTGSLFCVADARLAWFARAGLPIPPVDPPIDFVDKTGTASKRQG